MNWKILPLVSKFILYYVYFSMNINIMNDNMKYIMNLLWMNIFILLYNIFIYYIKLKIIFLLFILNNVRLSILLV